MLARAVEKKASQVMAMPMDLGVERSFQEYLRVEKRFLQK